LNEGKDIFYPNLVPYHYSKDLAYYKFK